MAQLIECVPNFSEGVDLTIIKQITDAIESVEGIKLLNVDPGKATNRTVVTFVGKPTDVVEAAFRGIKKAGEIIDMRKHKGEHPRMGATDVCPMIPIAEISMEETAEFARLLGKKVGEELGIPVFLYEAAASKPERSNLATIRAGEYEGLSKKLTDPNWQPDFGSAVFNEQSGATVIGARDFLVAYNVNLNTKSVKKANSIAFDVRENGRVKRIGNPINGEIVKDEQGNEVRIPGSLKSVKAIGWYIKEYDVAQISMNLTNISTTPVHIAFDEVCTKANERGIRVTGSELVGLIPLKSLLDAGTYFLKKQGRSAGVSEKELIHIAIKSLGLDDLGSFIPEEKIIEYVMRDFAESLIDLKLTEFADETASESPAPGGGSVAAYIGSLGISLATMVANLSAIKKGWESDWEYFSDWAEKGQFYKNELLKCVDEDTNSFNGIMEAFALPKNTESEKQSRTIAIQLATKNAIEVPLKVMKLAFASMEIIKIMAEKGNPNSASDAGVGALCARAAVLGAYLNVKINLGGIKDEGYKTVVMKDAKEIAEKAEEMEREIMRLVEEHF